MGFVGAFIVIVAISLALTAIASLIPAFGLMILLGVLHSYFAVVPAIGYGTSYVISLAIGVVMTLFRSAASATVSK